MRRRLILGMIVVAVFAASFGAKRLLRRKEAATPAGILASVPDDAAAQPCRRIVSLSPSITEILFALGLGDRVVGVTRYCDYPPEALKVAKIGGYVDPNYEAIIKLRPDLIIMREEHETPRRQFSELGYDILTVNHRSVAGILESVESIGGICGAEPKAEAIVEGIRARIGTLRRKTAGLKPPRVMISIWRNFGTGTLSDVNISGSEGFYSEMLALAGGVNAYQGSVTYPVVSCEGILRMNPDVIIDMVPDLAEQGLDTDRVLEEWKAVAQADAVRNGRVYVFSEGYVVIPGPRFINILEKMARVLYPQIDWN